MYLLLESIKVHQNKIHAWDYHKQRIDRSMAICYHLKSHPLIDIKNIQKYTDKLDSQTYKLRLLYNKESYRIEHHQYTLKPITSLRLVRADNIQYSEKYVERESLSKLYQQRGSADDILIIRNGMVTDTHYCNVALQQDGQWYTPKLPLLSGVMRQKLLDKKAIIPKDILVKDIPSYTHIRLFNAMVDFGEIEFDTGNIMK
jgi:4-amino-4-deoxychorismate lyase